MTTIKDVAVRAGVAPSTVSYVLSGSRKISEDTRRIVQQAIDDLGYHPRASARTLRSTRSNVLALALPRVAGGYRAVDGRFAIEISDAARAHGFDVLLMTAHEGVPGLRRIAGGGQADAAILMAVEMDDPRIEAMLDLGFPTALLGRSADDTALPWTDLDWEAAASLTVRELAAAGHREIAYLATTEREMQARRGYAIRGVAGARRAMLETGADVRVHPSTGDMALLARLVADLLRGERPATALVVQHVAALPHILAAVAAEGLRVPEDLTVVAVGNLPDDLGGLELPRIELPVSEMSAAVTRLAVEAIAARTQGASTAPPGHRLIPPAFVPGPRITAPGPRAAGA
ncbi:LacI family DNA-binding transcriptional regulator [Streptomyces sp. ME01-24h]|nr:LacI family DNA-binding transcriptional regulator [Streptomyces sp. ME19-03-3]MDX3352204.1 LacI family DNA-binding transcriptional regulator [Streptomyces sp. ME01-24h]